MKNILIIDDDDLFGESLKESFEESGYCANYFSDLDESTESKINKDVDTVLLDLRLKGKTGTSIIPKIKNILPDCKIIIMTGFGTISTAVDAIKKGADEYTTKPVTVKKIEELLSSNGDTSEDVDSVTSLDRVEREYIEYILAQENGNVSKAAKRLGLHRQSLQRKLKKWVPNK
jgi:two-component system response regulator RegA